MSSFGLRYQAVTDSSLEPPALSRQYRETATTTPTITVLFQSLIYQSKRREGIAPTASHAGPSTAYANPSAISPSSITKAQITASANPRIPSPSFQPPYPSPALASTAPEEPQVRVSTPTRWSLRNAFTSGGNDYTSAPFRSRATSNASSRPRRQGGRRLWNPTNSTPRVYPQTQAQHTGSRRRDRSELEESAVIAVPLSHPDIGSPKQEGSAPGEYPLLTLPEQRQKRLSGPTRASIQVERSGSSNGNSLRVSLPRSVSIDIERRKSSDFLPRTGLFLDKGKEKAVAFREDETTLKQLERRPTGYRKRGQNTSSLSTSSGLSCDNKDTAIMSTDLEQGPATQTPYEAGGTSAIPHNASNTSLPIGIGPAMSSNNTSIIGSDGPQNDPAEEWGPQHPCFPHMNPHVPLSSPLYQTTRIIRIRRDWMLEGDLAPTFSNLYPEILDPAGVSEQEFRTVIEKVNNELVPAFNPWAWRNLFDGVMGLLTGWVWDDLGLTGVKARLRNVENFLEDWNKQMEARSKGGAGGAPRIVSLRRTGYMNLDIQVPDPEINPVDERTDTGLSTATQ